MLFWRRLAGKFTTHRNPLFSPSTDLHISTIALDTLHTLHLGVYKAFCLKALWALILSDAWDTRASNKDELIHVSCLRCKADLFAWYRRQLALRPSQPLQKLQDVKPTMLGSEAHPSLSTKAAETGSLLGFCRERVNQHVDKLGNEGRSLATVGNSLVACRAVMAESGPVLNAGQHADLCHHARVAFEARDEAGIPFTPKWHLFLHICERAIRQGNPRFQSTFVDEGYNGRLAALAACCHRMTWYKRVLAGFRGVFTMPKKRAWNRR